MVDLEIKVVDQKDKRLGRQMVHDPRSRRFAVSTPIDRSKWRTKSIKIYDPPVNPKQCHGECTGTTKCMQLNAAGNRIDGVVLGMQKAHELYTFASHNDPWELAWPPHDTGSSGLASCVAAQALGLGGEFRHIFNGADGVVQSIMDGNAVSVGTWWTVGMMEHRNFLIEPTGSRIGGHQYLARAYNLESDCVLIRCWWGEGYRDVWIRRRHLNELILNDGDAHIQARKV